MTIEKTTDWPLRKQAARQRPPLSERIDPNKFKDQKRNPAAQERRPRGDGK